MGLDDCVLRAEISNSESLNFLIRSRSCEFLCDRKYYSIRLAFPSAYLLCHHLIEPDKSSKMRHIQNYHALLSSFISKPLSTFHHNRLLQDWHLLYQLANFLKRLVLPKVDCFTYQLRPSSRRNRN